MHHFNMRSVFFTISALFFLGIGDMLAQQPSQANPSGLPNPSFRPKEQEKTIDVFADLLYWHASETVDWAFTVKGDENRVKSAYQVLDFDPSFGFRVGVGYNMHHDQWDTQVSYTWFQAEAKDHASGGVVSGFLATRLSLLEPFDSGKIKCRLHYNLFDWDLGRDFCVSEFLSFRPFIGVKAGWINQQIVADWEKVNFIVPGFLYTASDDVRNDFRGGGPKGGVQGRWTLGKFDRHMLSLIGAFSGAYLWGNWTLRDRFVDILNTKTSIPMGNRNFGAVVLQALIGLGWDVNFDRQRSHFSLKAGYEIQDWLNHFQVFTNTSGTDNFDLILQGLTLEMRFDF